MFRARHLVTPAMLLSGMVQFGQAFANDSTMILKAGGIELVPNPWVTMEQEDLTIRPKQIDVHYVFRNTSEEDRAFLVAFPLPDIVGNDVAEAGIVMADEQGENFIGFRVKSDGKDVTPNVELRAYANGLDVTDDLKKVGLPLNPRLAQSEQIIALPAEMRAEFADRGIVRLFDTDAYPSWDLKTTYYWRQAFPKGQPVTIDHSYVPVPGLGFFMAESKEYDPWLFSDYCISDDTFGKAMTLLDRVSNPEMGKTLERRIVEYILTTGNNWQNAIGKFRLVVETEDPGRLLSTCFKGLQETTPGHFEFSATDYEPKDDLGFLFIEDPKLENP